MNGSGRFTEPPATRLIAIASPKALPIPKTIPVIIPDLAAGTTTLKIVCILVAPRASDVALKFIGTALIADALILITVGSIIIASTSTAARRLAPPVY